LSEFILSNVSLFLTLYYLTGAVTSRDFVTTCGLCVLST